MVALIISHLRPGDLIFTRSRTLNSWSIRIGTLGAWSHVKICLERSLIFEAAGKSAGIRLHPLTVNCIARSSSGFMLIGKLLDGDALVLRHPAANPDTIQSKLIEEIEHYWTFNYPSNYKLLHSLYEGWALKRYWDRLRHRQITHSQTDEVFCSQLVWWMLRGTGMLEPSAEHLHDRLSPGKLRKRLGSWREVPAAWRGEIGDSDAVRRASGDQVVDAINEIGMNLADEVNEDWRSLYNFWRQIEDARARLAAGSRRAAESRAKMRDLLEGAKHDYYNQTGVKVERPTSPAEASAGDPLERAFETDARDALDIRQQALFKAANVTDRLARIHRNWAGFDRASACLNEGCQQKRPGSYESCEGPQYCANRLTAAERTELDTFMRRRSGRE